MEKTMSDSITSITSTTSTPSSILPLLHYGANGSSLGTKAEFRRTIDEYDWREFSPPLEANYNIVCGPSSKSKVEWYLGVWVDKGKIFNVEEIALQPGPQNFTDEELRKANNHLQRQIDWHKVLRSSGEYNKRKEELVSKINKLQWELENLDKQFERSASIEEAQHRYIRENNAQLEMRRDSRKPSSKPRIVGNSITSTLEVPQSLIDAIIASGQTTEEVFGGLKWKVK